jgi:DNA mismatch endonuclease (patch repair protein)
MKETPEARSRIMRAVKGQNTSPEIAVRRLVHGMGYRYRLYRKDLPGKPDLVFSSRRKVIFIHGCFWHGHDCKRGARVPKTNREYWEQKVARNKERDIAHRKRLQEMGWNVLVIWECGLKDKRLLSRQIKNFLESQHSEIRI